MIQKLGKTQKPAKVGAKYYYAWLISMFALLNFKH